MREKIKQLVIVDDSFYIIDEQGDMYELKWDSTHNQWDAHMQKINFIKP